MTTDHAYSVEAFGITASLNVAKLWNLLSYLAIIGVTFAIQALVGLNAGVSPDVLAMVGITMFFIAAITAELHWVIFNA